MTLKKLTHTLSHDTISCTQFFHISDCDARLSGLSHIVH